MLELDGKKAATLFGAVLICICIVAILFIVGASQTPMPADVIPKISQVVGWFQQKRDEAEGRATLAKQVIDDGRLTRGAELYGDARATHNGCIAYVVASLETGTIDAEYLSRLMASVNWRHDAFQSWYLEARPEDNGVGSTEGMADAIGTFADIIVKLAQLRDERGKEQRRVLREQLNAAMLEEWQSL